MAYDGLLTSVVAEDLSQKLVGAKIEKVMQPESDLVILQVKTATDRKRLLIDVSSSGSRVCFTKLEFENPLDAPSFCMLLRKHLSSGVITDVCQVDKERIIEITIESLNEIGLLVKRRLIAEVMGRHSNLILVDGLTEKIVDCIKRISLNVNRYRQILPGVIYERPPVLNLENTDGLSPAAKEALSMGADINDRLPRVYVDDNGKPKDFHVIDLKQYDGIYKSIDFDDVYDAMDYYYSNRMDSNRVMQKADNLQRTINGIIDKQLLKKQRLLEDIKKADEADIYRIKGELINANLHLIKPGDKKVKLVSFYDGNELEIALDEKLSAARNAQSYFKKYNKAKNAKKEKLPLLAALEKDIEYLESVLSLVSTASSYEELDAIKDELAGEGFLRISKAAKRKKPQKPKPRRFELASGLEVLVGRNNIENDYITTKLAEKTDWWFHTKDIHGSHLLMVCHGIDPSPEDMYEAASIAAWYSKGRNSDKVPVDYCMAKYVKKPNGAKPGMVTFTNNGTTWAHPKNPEK